MTTEEINNNLNILVDPTFTTVNRLFVLAYQNADERQSYSQFYLPKVMVKYSNVIINTSHHQLQYARGSFGLITQAHASMYVSTLIQVIISCSTHWAPLA